MGAKKEIIEQVIKTYHAAAAANRDKPTRQAQVIRLDPSHGDELLVTADVHGDRRNFRQILQLADLDNHPRRHLVMQEVCHGGPTYPGGQGCMSHLMLEDIAALCVQYPRRFHFLISNHELAELTDFPILKSRRMLNLMFRCGMQEMYGDAGDEVREAMLTFLASLPMAVSISWGAFISHSIPADIPEKGFDPGIFHREVTPADRKEGGELFRLVWGRDFREENAATFATMVNAKLLLTGHEPCSAGFATPNKYQVILDCCGNRAHVVTLPIDDVGLSQAEVTQRIRPLFAAQADAPA